MPISTGLKCSIKTFYSHFITNNGVRPLIAILVLLWSSECFAQTDEQNKMFDMSLDQLLEVEVYDDEKRLNLYGYFDVNLEQVFNKPVINTNGITEYETRNIEWSIPNFHIYGQSQVSKKINILFNLAQRDGMLEIRNAWGNIKFNDFFQLRLGKIYRRFGLYNEKLDQLPTFMGIEPPELFDNDHLFLPRTTSVMVHGTKWFGERSFSYALSTGNGESGVEDGVVPLGWDFRLKFRKSIIGTSGYLSSISQNGRSQSTVKLGDGSPRGGIAPWMSGDRYWITGAYLEKAFGKFVVKTAYWYSKHNAVRDPEAVLTLFRNVSLSTYQQKNFVGEASDQPVDNLATNDVILNKVYSVESYYCRVGYEIKTGIGAIIPYAFFDWMRNPETIAAIDWGGDDEAGLADNGSFIKPSLGVMYRPIEQLALKVDGGIHRQRLNNELVTYPEIRLDLSFAFSN